MTQQEIGTTRKKVSLIILGALIVAAVIVFVAMPKGAKSLVDDTNGDGKADLWAWTDEEGRMTRLEKDRSGDGNVDWRELFSLDEATGAERREKIESDTNNDGRFDTTMFFVAGKVSRIEHDRNADGKIDMNMYYDDPNRPPARTERDEDFDGEFEWQTTRQEKGPETKPAQASPKSGGKS
ncbi:MAG: hypothetical protein P9L99_19355 [Candidatus Lernaella stagnicola]|nr:hypothetical protein [Candidatus Lernaella stagnicola]